MTLVMMVERQLADADSRYRLTPTPHNADECERLRLLLADIRREETRRRGH